MVNTSTLNLWYRVNTNILHLWYRINTSTLNFLHSVNIRRLHSFTLTVHWQLQPLPWPRSSWCQSRHDTTHTVLGWPQDSVVDTAPAPPAWPHAQTLPPTKTRGISNFTPYKHKRNLKICPYKHKRNLKLCPLQTQEESQSLPPTNTIGISNSAPYKHKRNLKVCPLQTQ